MSKEQHNLGKSYIEKRKREGGKINMHMDRSGSNILICCLSPREA
jgi:hypothetical protein